MKKRFVLSTVGISIFLGTASDSAERNRLNSLSNAKDGELESDDLDLIISLADKAQSALETGDIASVRSLSAELNGLYGLYQNKMALAKQDIHWLIATDTALGRETATVIKNFLTKQGVSEIQIYTPDDLSTASSLKFNKGMQNLIEWCEETIPGYEQSDYKIVFNLTGAFKSLQGYLNIIGMFYADEVVYIFEGSTELLRIPRLPIQVNLEAIQDQAVKLAMMEHSHEFSLDELGSLPEGMLSYFDQHNVTLSNWGRLIWLREKNKIYQKALLTFPRIVYTQSFCKDFQKAERQDKARLQDTLAEVSVLLEEFEGNTAQLKNKGGIQYDNYVNAYDKDKNPIGHFRVAQHLRVSCISKEGKLFLRRYGLEPDVNRDETKRK